MFLTAVVGLALISLASAAEVLGNVAFTAVFNDDATIPRDSTVRFPIVYTNHGSGYDKSTGVFTATKGGLYMFHLHAMSQKNEEFELDLFKNDHYVFSAFGRMEGDQTMGSNTVSLRLFKNDKVQVKAKREAYLYGRDDEVYAIFTGYMVGPLDSNQ